MRLGDALCGCLAALAALAVAAAALDQTLNLEELKLLHYDIHLAPDSPVAWEKEEAEEGGREGTGGEGGGEEGEREWVALSSAGGQAFRCELPAPSALLAASPEARDEAAARDFATANVTATLQFAFELDPRCLSKVRLPPLSKYAKGCDPVCLKTVGWWTYEFCYGESIKQYHLEGTIGPLKSWQVTRSRLKVTKSSGKPFLWVITQVTKSGTVNPYVFP